MEIGQSIRQAQSWSSSTFSHFTRLWRYAGFHLCLCDARVDCDMASQVWILPCPSKESNVTISICTQRGQTQSMTAVTHSNCRAAILLGKPVTKHVISHGRRVSLDVRTAPPLASPLCCLSRRGGFGVLPMYVEE